MAARKNPFDRGLAEATEYDAWYDTEDGQAVLAGEVAALTEISDSVPRPWIDVGTGTARFGAAFNVDVGVDPAPAMLHLAAMRLPRVVQGVAEALPFQSSVIGGVLTVTTFEFVEDPLQAVQESARVLIPRRRVASRVPSGGRIVGSAIRG